MDATNFSDYIVYSNPDRPWDWNALLKYNEQKKNRPSKSSMRKNKRKFKYLDENDVFPLALLPLDILENIISYLPVESVFIINNVLNRVAYIGKEQIPLSLLDDKNINYEIIETNVYNDHKIDDILIPESVKKLSLCMNVKNNYGCDSFNILIPNNSKLEEIDIYSESLVGINPKKFMFPDMPTKTLTHLNVCAEDLLNQKSLSYLFPKLRYLKLELMNFAGDTKNMLESIRKCTNLRTLILSYSKFDKCKDLPINHIFNCAPRKLKHLELNSFISEEYMTSKFEEKCTRLETLIIKTNTINYSVICAILKMKILKKLVISVNDTIVDTRLEEIFWNLTRLENLKISAQSINIESLNITLPNLRELKINEKYFYNIPIDIKNLVCPNLRIINIGESKLLKCDVNFDLVQTLRCSIPDKFQSQLFLFKNLSILDIEINDCTIDFSELLSELKKVNYINVKSKESIVLLLNKHCRINREFVPDTSVVQYITNKNGSKVPDTFIFKMLNNNKISELINILRENNVKFDNDRFSEISDIISLYLPHEFINQLDFKTNSTERTYELVGIKYATDAHVSHEFLKKAVDTIDLSESDIIEKAGVDYVQFMLNQGFELHSSYYHNHNLAFNFKSYLVFSVWRRKSSFVFIKVDGNGKIESITSTLY